MLIGGYFLYNIVLILPYINMNPPWVYTCSLIQGKEQQLREEIPHVQGKRNPSKMVGAERGHQRADRLKAQSQTTGQSVHTFHSLV